jgi:hypothetical protein
MIKSLSTGILTVLAVGTGFLLSNAGKPYNAAFFNVHKLVSVAAVVFTVIISTVLLKGEGQKSFIIPVLVFFAAAVIALVTSGGIMSINENAGRIFLIIHRIAPFAAVLSTGMLLYMYIKH